jgi:RNA 2',3'-cyclic 3'-phosphodiesterase
MPDVAAVARASIVADKHLKGRGMIGRPLAPHRFHVTLFPVGGSLGTVPDEIKTATQAAAASVCAEPFEVSLDRATSFHRSRGMRPYVLLGGDGVADIMPFCRNLGGAMHRAGLHVGGGYSFRPHSTLAYASEYRSEIPVDPVSWIEREFVLAESWVGLTQRHVRGRWKFNSSN